MDRTARVRHRYATALAKAGLGPAAAMHLAGVAAGVPAAIEAAAESARDEREGGQ